MSYHTLEHLAFISDSVFSNLSTGDKADIEKLALLIKNRLDDPLVGQTFTSAVLDPEEFPGVLSENFFKARNNRLTKEEEKQYKRIIQTVSRTLRGQIKDSTSGAKSRKQLLSQKSKTPDLVQGVKGKLPG